MNDYRKHKTPGPLRAAKRYSKTKSKIVTLATQQEYIEVLPYKVKYIIGIDSCGEGCLAGPYVAGAAVFPVNLTLPIKDSKLYTNERAREQALASFRYRDDVELFLWMGSADKLNQYGGMSEAFEDSIMDLVTKATEKYPESVVFLDGNRIPAGLRGHPGAFALPKADGKIPAVAAASIHAKVYRDKYMSQLAGRYPTWDFHTNKGYPTHQHLQYLKELPLTPEHRTYTRPVKEIINGRRRG